MTDKKTKPTVHRFINDVYQYALFVRIGGTREHALRWFEKKFNVAEHESKATVHGSMIFMDDERSHMIWLADAKNLGILAHEALHSVNHVMRGAGVGPMCEDNEEAYAYLLQWTVNRIAGAV